MLTGYQKTKAVALIHSRISPEDYKVLPSGMLRQLIGQCVDADFDYMISNGISLPDGTDGHYFYNKESARDFISVALLRNNDFSEEAFDELLTLVEDYMDYNRSYLELNGLQYHEDQWLSRYRPQR